MVGEKGNGVRYVSCLMRKDLQCQPCTQINCTSLQCVGIFIDLKCEKTTMKKHCCVEGRGGESEEERM